jgi:hypothetical protein
MSGAQEIIKRALPRSDKIIWDRLSLSAICLCLFIFLAQWPQLPFFLDMYYHLAVAKGFEAAGGISLHNFWEYGPAGAPHLYPPLMHIIILFFIKTGITDIILLKSISVVMPVLMLAVLWLIMRKIVGERTAFFTVFLSTCASLFLISASFTPAATLACILLLYGLYCIHKGYIMLSAFIFGLISYAHTGIFIVCLLFLMASAAAKVLDTRGLLKISIISIIIGLPWIMHVILSLPEITYHATANMPVRIYPIIILFSIIGMSQFRRYGLFTALLFSLFPMLALYPFRFFSAQGMLALLIFSGIGLNRAYRITVSKMSGHKILKKYKGLFAATLLSYLTFFAPSVEFHNKSIRLEISDSLVTSLFEGKEPGNILSTGLYDEKKLDMLSRHVKRHSQKGEFIWSNNRYLGGLIAARTGRPAISGMLLEIQPKERTCDALDARILIIIDENGNAPAIADNDILNSMDLIDEIGLEGATIRFYRNSSPGFTGPRKIPKPFIDSATALILLIAYGLAAIVLHKKTAIR